MKFSSQTGKSFIETLGIMVAICLVLGFGIGRYLQEKHHRDMSEIIGMMHTFFERYQASAPDIFKQSSVPNGPVLIRNYALLEECNEKQSIFNKYKNVCAFKLGELDVNTEVDFDSVQSYVYVHFLDMLKTFSCRRFLAVGWEKILPKTWWNDTGYIGVISENTKGKMYFSYNSEYIRNDGAEENPNPQHLKDVCNVCRGSRYCTVLFSFMFNEDTLKNITFPAEVVGESEASEEDSEVTKEGKTYTKTSGNYKEIVTYSGSNFSGSTYSFGSFRSLYEGTYSRQGITSYTSYSDPNKQNIIQKIDNVVYDENGNVLYYQKDSQKILLTGNADDCLIMDDANNTKQFGHCSSIFGETKSSLLLQYDGQGFLKEAVFSGEGNEENKAFTFDYDPKTGALANYCEARNNKCHKVTNGRTVKDILRQDIPETVGRFNSMYGNYISGSAYADKRHFMTKDEVLRRVRDSDNKIKIKIK